MTTSPIRDPKQVKLLTQYFFSRGQLRDHSLIVFGVHTALRISDLLRLSWDDVWDFERNKPCEEIAIIEKKTKKNKIIKLHRSAKQALIMRTDRVRGGALFANRRTGKAISRVQAYRVIVAAATKLSIGKVSCHSLRKTFGYHA